MRPKNVRRILVNLLTILGVLIFVAGCNENATPKSGNNTSAEDVSETSKDTTKVNRNISIGTTPVGVSYNSVGTGLAKVISTNSDVKMSVKPSNGISAWGPQLNRGEIELGVASGPDLVWAFRGENGYEPTKNMRLLVRGNYLGVTGAAVRENTSIHSIADLKGKKVAADYPGSAIAKMVLEAALTVNGLGWADVQQVPIPTTSAGIEAIQDNRVDAAFALTPTTPIAQEVHNAVGMRSVSFLDNVSVNDIDSVEQETIDNINAIVPGVRLAVIKESGYIAEDQIGLEYPSLMVASSHLSDEVAYEIMETLWMNYEELHPIHDWFTTWTPEGMFDPEPDLPYHPGAVQFFKDKGIWNDEVEKIRKYY